MTHSQAGAPATHSMPPPGGEPEESQDDPLDAITKTAALDERYASILRRLDELGIEKHVFTQTHEELRAFREKSHEREVLLPIWRSVIGITDRCRENTRKLRSTFKALGPSMDSSVAVSMQHVIAARQADLAELEALLARFGVECFQVAGSQFDPRQQESVKRVAASHDRPPGQIAARIFPGYRRNGTIVRRECVSVFVVTNQTANP